MINYFSTKYNKNQMIKDLNKQCLILQCQNNQETDKSGQNKELNLKCFTNGDIISLHLFFCSKHLEEIEKLNSIIEIINDECIFDINESTYEVKSIELKDMFSLRKRLISSDISNYIYKILLSSYDGNLDPSLKVDDSNKIKENEIFKNVLISAYKKLEEVLV